MCRSILKLTRHAIVRIRYRERVLIATSCFTLGTVICYTTLTAYLLFTLDQSLWFVDKQWDGVSDDVEGGQGVIVLCQDHQLVQPLSQEISISVLGKFIDNQLNVKSVETRKIRTLILMAQKYLLPPYFLSLSLISNSINSWTFKKSVSSTSWNYWYSTFVSILLFFSKLRNSQLWHSQIEVETSLFIEINI